MSQSPTYEIYAVKFGSHVRKMADNFIGGDPHDGPGPIDYFVWAIKGGNRAWVVDTVTSPAIDKADPASGAAAEPAPNGGRANLGIYGRTGEASKSP